MKYVVDSCVAVKWVLAESLSDKVQQLREESRQAIHELVAPDVVCVQR